MNQQEKNELYSIELRYETAFGLRWETSQNEKSNLVPTFGD